MSEYTTHKASRVTQSCASIGNNAFRGPKNGSMDGSYAKDNQNHGSYGNRNLGKHAFNSDMDPLMMAVIRLTENQQIKMEKQKREEEEREQRMEEIKQWKQMEETSIKDNQYEVVVDSQTKETERLQISFRLPPLDKPNPKGPHPKGQRNKFGILMEDIQELDDLLKEIGPYTNKRKYPNFMVICKEHRDYLNEYMRIHTEFMKMRINNILTRCKYDLNDKEKDKQKYNEKRSADNTRSFLSLAKLYEEGGKRQGPYNKEFAEWVREVTEENQMKTDQLISKMEKILKQKGL